MLPLTSETHRILSMRTFEKMKIGSALIHVGRGGHLVVSDLQSALETGRLRGAIVDVFPAEPLTSGDPLWEFPNLLITPHMASLSNDDTVADQIIENIRRQSNGEPLLNRVDSLRGY
jgi:glyoxylate/hydroxypyruvate reductase A